MMIQLRMIHHYVMFNHMKQHKRRLFISSLLLIDSLSLSIAQPCHSFRSYSRYNYSSFSYFTTNSSMVNNYSNQLLLCSKNTTKRFIISTTTRINFDATNNNNIIEHKNTFFLSRVFIVVTIITGYIYKYLHQQHDYIEDDNVCNDDLYNNSDNDYNQTEYKHNNDKHYLNNIHQYRNNNIYNFCLCEGSSSSLNSSHSSSDASDTTTNNTITKKKILKPPSWISRQLYQYGFISNLSLLPRYLYPNDIDLTLSKKSINQRKRDEKMIHTLQQKIQQNFLLLQKEQQLNTKTNTKTNTNNTVHNNHTNNNEDNAVIENHQNELNQLIQQTYHILYGNHITPIQRQEFLNQYGCTGYTEDIITTLLQLEQQNDNEQNDNNDTNDADLHHHRRSRHRRGFIEIGAGNGQWARILTDRYNQKEENDDNKNNKLFEYVLAYDNMTSIPLNPIVYHNKTKVYHDYFYHHIRPMPIITNSQNKDNDDNDQQQQDIMDMIFQQWQCRHRILLLIYPPPGPMAYHAVKSYTKYNNTNNNHNKMIIVYVGEGRGGANANDDFFNLLEGHDNNNNVHEENKYNQVNSNNVDLGPWILHQMIPVHICGTKGYEKLYVFKQQ